MIKIRLSKVTIYNIYIITSIAYINVYEDISVVAIALRGCSTHTSKYGQISWPVLNRHISFGFQTKIL